MTTVNLYRAQVYIPVYPGYRCGCIFSSASPTGARFRIGFSSRPRVFFTYSLGWMPPIPNKWTCLDQAGLGLARSFLPLPLEALGFAEERPAGSTLQPTAACGTGRLLSPFSTSLSLGFSVLQYPKPTSDRILQIPSSNYEHVRMKAT